ncbi:sigma-B regulation protein RsbU (phosphoserine phosphatase) [Catalinimonas alkaloidigena]|uniref:Sigma-B regulation protein RsbU (Phosphoserine phosphatase) n=1 Tax=Catalinimonas alkaloidigena TaxID=1075417 RepID=A0A1G8WII9_9BACT|nr:PP2C family protein-serine/threonine phosphatase [Catalinimonas alkaloidigena]SDJ77475.1 sigma-B regulation protein RsbU (phosphoserine phosphatase) [Catalinimonas alkaloidigena]
MLNTAILEHPDFRYRLKQLELNSLLEITQAINEEVPEESLYKIFQFTLRANLGIERLALYVREREWSCKVHFGIGKENLPDCVTKELSELTSVARVQEEAALAPYHAFDFVVPVQLEGMVRAFVLVGEKKGEPLASDSLSFIQTLSNILLVAVENKRLVRYRIEQEALRREMQIAQRVQNLLFPKSLPNSDFLSLKADYWPHHSVGGDYYDCIDLTNDRFLMCVADVSGKGIPAALLMSNFQASLRTLARQTTDLVRIVKELNHQIRENSNGENFITFFGALCDRSAKTLTYVNAGHNPPVLVKTDGSYQLLESGTTVLGIFETLPFVQQETLPMCDSLLFAYTDGVTETFNQDQEQFGMERLLDLLLLHRDQPLEGLHRHLMAELDQFRGGVAYSDDVTLLSARLRLAEEPSVTVTHAGP